MATQRGFTLAELIVVLLLTSILAAVAIPRLFNQGEFAARGARDFVGAALRYAQKSAVAMRRNVCVSLGTTSLGVTYASTAGSTQACGSGNALANPANGLPYSDASNVLPGGASLAGTASVSFDALGRPMSAALSPLTTALTISVNGNATPITIEPETGTVH
jgi:MSHA pilin protein MshC